MLSSEEVLDVEKYLCHTVRKKCPLVSDIKQPRTLAEKRPCTTLLSRMCGLPLISSPSLHRASRRTEDDGIHYHELLIWHKH